MSQQIPADAPGDFYVLNSACSVCGFTQLLAPSLIEHAEDSDGCCYFRKQPENESETEEAIQALAGSCVNALRYRGRDESIMRRLYEIGAGELCDNRPLGDYKPIIWTKATFHFPRPKRELADLVTQGLMCNDDKIINYYLHHYSFGFARRPPGVHEGHLVTFFFEKDDQFLLTIELERKSPDARIGMRHTAMRLNEILRKASGITALTWFDLDGVRYLPEKLR